ncbi:MAG: hypothetical protein ACKOEG_10415 [Chthoniobacterales bacterium]
MAFSCPVFAALLTMATVLANAGNPVVRAAPAPDLTPASMQASDLWDRAPAVELRGFDGKDAQKTEVRVLWNDDWLFFSFACADGAIVSPGEKDGLDHFRLGDTAEVFVARRGDPAYAEVHATPAGRKTSYFCRDYRQPAEPPREAGKIVVAAAKTTPGWRAFIAVPRDVLAQSRGENEYDIFFARYDYESAGDKPALSAFPVQRGDKPDFHRRGDYAILRLTP